MFFASIKLTDSATLKEKLRILDIIKDTPNSSPQVSSPSEVHEKFKFTFLVRTANLFTH